MLSHFILDYKHLSLNSNVVIKKLESGDTFTVSYCVHVHENQYSAVKICSQMSAFKYRIKGGLKETAGERGQAEWMES